MRDGTVTFDDGAVLRARMPRAETPPDDVVRAIEGTEFLLWYTFDGDALRLVHLAERSLEPYDAAAARELHDAWLATRLGKGKPWNAHAYPFGGVEYRYRWGTVGSYAIPQDLNCFIGVEYT